MTGNAQLHSITIYKHKMDLKLYATTLKVGKCITITFFSIFLLKHNLIMNLNICPKYL
jgi:hypothetical protein